MDKVITLINVFIHAFFSFMDEQSSFAATGVPA
jgi:hypothetical protein